jgi:hypothetical protein
MLTALALGAGLMFLLDPDRGRARRARVRDRLAHAARAGRGALGATGRDVAHRTAGAAARLKGRLHHEPVDDEVLVERVRAHLGRAVSHPRAIQVTAEKGVVTLTGPILTAEVPRLVRAAERTGGVREVICALEEHDDPGKVPALQGGGRSRRTRGAMLPPSPATRLAAGVAGVALAGAGATRRGAAGALLALAGLGLIARAAIAAPARRDDAEPAAVSNAQRLPG